MDLSALQATDKEVMQLLESLDDQEIQSLLMELHRNVQVKEDRNKYDIHLTNKVRLIDPLVLYQKKLQKGSGLSENVRRMGEEAKKKFECGTYVKVIVREFCYKIINKIIVGS